MNPERLARTVAAGAWLAVLAWLWIWLAVLPEPAGKRLPLLALLLSIPVVLPLPGILASRERPVIWGAYAALVLLIFAVAEAWSAAGESVSAGLLIALTVVYLLAAAYLTRRGR